MLKLKSWRVVGLITLTAILVFTLFAHTTLAEESSQLTDSELDADTVGTISDSDTVEFILDARWGFVRGNPYLDRIARDYQGSIIAESTDDAQIVLQKKLIFENDDTITSETDPVSWLTKIQGHWDGVLVQVRAKANAKISVNISRDGTTQTITKTAKEWFGQSGWSILELSGHEKLAVKTYPRNHRRHAVLIWWGKKEVGTQCLDDTQANCTDPAIDFSGNLTMDADNYVKLKRALRFERNDQIEENDRDHISWTSTISTDRDGLMVLMLPNKNSVVDSGFTISLPEVNDGWSRHYTFSQVREGVRETVTVNDVDYVIVVGQRQIPYLLVRAKKTRQLYLIKDNIRCRIPDSEILSANQLEMSEAVEMDDDELESFEQGDDLTYPDGTVIEEEGSQNSYIISNGIKRRLSNNSIKEKLLTLRQRARQVISSKLDKIEQGPIIDSEKELPDGTLVKVDGETAVWLIQGGKRSVFNSGRIFSLHRLNWNNIKSITQGQLLSYQWKKPVEYPDGSLVKVPTDPKVYLINKGKRYWIETEQDLLGLGYKFSQIIDMPPTEIINYPEGQPLIADETDDIIEF